MEGVGSAHGRGPRHGRWTLRTHLFAMAGAVLGVSGVAGLALTAGTYSAAERRAVAATRGAAGQVAATLDQDLRQAAMLTARTAPSIAPVLDQRAAVAANPRLCSLTFTGFGLFPADGAVHIVTADGGILCSSDDAAVGRSFAAAPWFARLVGGEPVTTSDSRDPVSGRAVAVIAAPVRDSSGAVAGALVETVALQSLAPGLADRFGGPTGRQFTLVGGGRVLSSSIDPSEHGQPFPALSDGRTARDSRGEKRIWGAGAVPATGWQIWAATSEAGALEPARAERRRLGLLLAVAVAAAVGLALLVNRRFVRPIRSLSATVGRAEREPAARAPVEGPAELADLALGLNHMLATRQHDEQRVANLAAELEATAISLVEAREQERQALAISLHDTTLQGLIAALWQVDSLLERSGDSPGLERLRQALETLIGQTRAVIRELRPPALHESGLGAAVEELARRTTGECGIAVEVDDRLAGGRFAVDAEMLVYRVVQEALLNVRKHAQATRVRVVLDRKDGRLRASVADDGIGVDEAVIAERDRAGRLGITSMRDTVGLAKGRFSIAPGDRGGTVVTVEVPVPAGGPLPRGNGGLDER